MARPRRYILPGLPQHVTQRGNNRSTLFTTDSDYRFFLRCLRLALAQYQSQLHAYVLMTNHVHLLMTPTNPTGIARLMQQVGRSYVRYFNLTYGRTGTLWEGRYRAALVSSE